MKKIFLLALLFLFSNSFNLFAQQYYYTFSELKGMEDSNSDTHLFYRTYTVKEANSPFSNYIENSIHHLDIKNNIDTLFLWDGEDYSYNTTGILDLKFLDTDPSKYIYCGFHAVLDPTAFIQRYDESTPSFYGLGTVENLEIQNDSIMFATTTTDSGIIKSTDGGRNWFPFNSAYEKVISINPNNNDIFFADNDNLYKSTNGGLNFSKVDTSNYNYSQFFYDKDSIHIYNLSNNLLKVSDDDGNAFSWTERYSSSNPIYVSIDYSQSGSIYLADGQYIYHSTDHGLTFNEYKTLDRRVVGIYKKPSSDKLYAATKYNLYEITSDSIRVIKSLQPDPALAEYYPLAIGDKWVYESTSCNSDFYPVECDHSINVAEVTGDTILSNGFNYFIIKESNGYSSNIDFERYNQEDATVRRYTNDTSFFNNEYIIEDLLADVGDTLCTSRFFEYAYDCIPRIFTGENNDYVFESYYPAKTFDIYGLVIYEYSLVKGFGIDNISLNFDFGNNESKLKGCIINGVLYGDTTVVDVNDPNKTPKEFLLSQNYPNPFNPNTKIKFVIPKSSFVNLKVYDVLGREVATLVNEEKHPGSYEVEFNPVSGIRNLASGIYFYKLQVGSYSSTKKMIYLK